MLRPFLVAVVLLGAGVAFAQEPRTYSRPGEALVAALGAQPAEWWLAVVGSDVYVEGVHDLTVSFLGLDSTVYVGQIEVSDPLEFREFVLSYFYESFCRTMIQFDCGRLRKIGSLDNPVTETGLDDYWYWRQAWPSFGFGYFVNNPPPLDDAPAEWYCVDVSGGGRRFVSWFSGGSTTAYSGAMGLAGGSTYPWQGYGSPGGGTGVALQWLNGHLLSQCPDAVMLDYVLGNYVERQPSFTLPVAHPDVPVGLRVAAQEVAADIERVSGYAVLPRGMTWSPLPTAAQLGGDPSADPESPSSGGGGGYEEAPEDGGTECNVLNIPCNLRRLFVPGEGVIEGRVGDLQDVAATRFPFNLVPVGAIGQLLVANQEMLDNFDPEEHCPRVGATLTDLAWAVTEPTGLSGEEGGYGGAFGVELRDGMNICVSPVVAFAHSTVRPFLMLLTYFALLAALLTRVFGGGR